jgi:hypothetical protein
MEILYHWAKECGDIPQVPASLKRDGLKTAELIQFVDHEVGKMCTRNRDFPTILLRPDASKMLRDKYVVERNLDGSTKREEPITAKMAESQEPTFTLSFLD